MPATPDRIAFITQAFRKVISGPDSTVESAYGDLARETAADDPIQTDFDSNVDTQWISNERLDMMSEERARYTMALPGGLSFALSLNYSQATPTGTVIDLERNTNKAALTTDIGFDFRRGGATIGMWG